MDVKPQILWGQVMHRRLFPAVNGFCYRIFYVALPLERLMDAPIAVNRPGVISFHERDHGARDGSPLLPWLHRLCDDHGVVRPSTVTLLTLPRMMGYVFNPVSFWVGRGHDGRIKTVLVEVNNTFGETHSYLCVPDDGAAIDGDTWLAAPKVFHVSPFLPRVGSYRFRFKLDGPVWGVWIDYFDDTGALQLVTALSGRLVPMTRARLGWAVVAYPFMTLGAIGLIHWQAVKLWIKKQKFYRKPLPETKKVTISRPIT
jgi:hypothetical protein